MIDRIVYKTMSRSELEMQLARNYIRWRKKYLKRNFATK